MDKKNLEGKVDKVTGKIKEIGGVATDNRDWEAEGKLDQVKGKVKEGLGNLRKGQSGIRHDDVRGGDFGEPSVGKEGSRCGGSTHLEHPITCEECQIAWARLF